MKFGISRVTDDWEPQKIYFVTIDAPEHFSFYCGESDIQMIERALFMENLPHPQRAPEGCPAKGCKTCKECVENLKLRKGSERE